MAKKILNLLFIDEEQLYVEHLIGLLSNYYDEINLGFWDEKSELVKALRNDWDVLVFNRAYDLTFTDVIGILQEQDTFIPMIHLLPESEPQAQSNLVLPEVIDGDMIKTLTVGQDGLIVMAICLQAAYSQSRRQMKDLRHIIKEAELRADVLIKNSKSAVAYIDQGVHVYANNPYLEMFGYQSMEEIIGVPVVDLFASGDGVKGFKQFLRKFDKGDRSQVEFSFESKKIDGATFASKLQLATATLDGEPVTQMIIQRHEGVNAAEIAQKLAEAERQDSLTGLLNRTGFSVRLDEIFQDVQAGATNAALLYVSLDNIGKISSSAGLQGVDTAVRYIAALLAEVFADGVVGRFGDSTFAIVLTDVNQDNVLAVAESVRARTETLLIEVGQKTVTTTLSIGVVMIDANVPDAQTALERAIDTVSDIIAETDNQGNKVRLFDISEHASNDDDALAEYIKNALSNNHFVLRYQPIYDINTDSSDLFEVYIALPMADGTELTFDKFAQVAKKHELLDKIDRWILINASKALAQVRQEHPTARLLLGLSSASLADTQLAKIVLQLVKAIGDSGNAYPLSLQFHEQDLVDYLAVAKRQFMALSDIHCPVGLHNFGVTAKSAELLAHLTPKIARLARPYTKDLDRPANMETVQGLVAKASEQGVDVLMPYIGDAQTMSMAWSIGARYLQGDYLQVAAENMVFAEPEPEV